MSWKKWLKRVVIAVVISVLVRTIWLIGEREWRLREGNRDLAAAVAETDAADPNWRWDDLQATRVRPPDEQNGAPLIPQIKAAISPAADRLWRELGELARPDLPANVRLPDEWVVKARDRLAASPEAVRLARTLKDRPYGFREIKLAQNPLDTLLPDTQSTRDAANVLRWSLWVSLERGDYPRAADELVAGLNASRSVGDEPFLISQLVRIAVRQVALRSVERAIGQTRGPADLAALRLEALQEALERDAEEPLFLYGVRGERALFDVLIQRLGDGTLDFAQIGGSPPGSLSPAARFGMWRYRGRLPGDRAFCLRWMSSAVAAGRLPIHEQPTALAGLPPIVRDKDHLIIVLLLPAIDKVATAHWRTTAEMRAAVAGIACERFRLKHGRWPESLAALWPGFLPAVPLDPYDGQPLRYQKLDDGVVIHSVGRNPAGTNTAALHPGLPDGIDIGFRLWNPEARRQPPPTEPKEGEQP